MSLSAGAAAAPSVSISVKTTFREIRQRTGNRIDALDADGLQIRPEHGLDRSLPTGLDDEILRQPAPLVERLRLQPAIDLLGGLAERDFLQRLERREPAAIGLQALAQLIEVLETCFSCSRSC